MKDAKVQIIENHPSRQFLNDPESTIRLKVQTKNMLKKLSEGDSFDRTIRKLINQRNITVHGNLEAVKYNRVSQFLELGEIGIEFEYNEPIGLEEYTFDLKIKKIYTKNQILNPSVYFKTTHRTLYKNKEYLEVYLECLAKAIEKKFKINTSKYVIKHKMGSKINKTTYYDPQLNCKTYKDITKNIIAWKKMYVENNLSNESFEEDIAKILTKFSG